MNQGQIVVTFVADKSGYISGAKDVQARSKQLSQQLDADTQAATDRMSDRFSTLGESIKVALAAASVATVAFGASFVKSAADLQGTSKAFEVLIGNTDKANQLFGQLATYANSTPFEFPDIAAAGRILLGFGISADNVFGDIKMLGDIAAASGADFKALALVFGQVNATGKLMGQDALQLINNNVAIFNILGKKMGITAGEVKQRMEEGKISAELFNAALADMTKEGGQAFKGTDQLAQTFNGRLSTLSDAAMEFGRNLLGVKIDPQLGLVVESGGIFDRLSNLLVDITKSLQDFAPKIKGAFDWLFANGETVKNTIIGIAAAFATIRVAGLVSDFAKAEKTLDLFIGAKNANGIRAIGSALGSISSGALTAAKFIGSLTLTVIKNTAIWTANAVRVTAVAIAHGAVRTATLAWAAAQWLLNAALNANPIGLIILGVAALAAGLALLWANSETFRNIVTGAFDAVWGGMQAVWNWTAQNWPLLLAILTGPIGLAVLAIVQNWESIKTFFGNLWNAISSTAVSVWSGLTGFFVGVWNTISGAVSGAWNGIRNAVVSGVNNVVDFVRSLPGSILGAIGSLGGLLVGAGRDLISGLINGIGNASNAVVDKIIDICKGSLDAVKNFFGIHSPSRVMEKIGGFWGQGFAGGIAGSMGAIMSAVDTVNNGLLGGFADPLTPSFVASGSVSMSADDIWGKSGKGSGAGEPQIVQNNYLNNGVTVDQVNRSLTKQIRRG